MKAVAPTTFARMSESLMSRKPLHKRLSRGFATRRSLPPIVEKNWRQKLPGGSPQGCEMPGETTDGFIQTCKPTRYTSYEQLMAWEQEGTQLVNYIQKSLPTVTAGRLTDEVLARLREVKRHLQSYRDEIAGIIDAALELNDRRDCYSLLDRVRSMLERSIRPQDADDLREIADCTANLLRDMEEIGRAHV